MPIAQLQAETARATGIYTWATKPPAAGNEGLEIIVSDLQNTRWIARAGAWRPVNGSCRLILDLTGVQTQQGVFDFVPGVTPIKIPVRDILSTPGANISSMLAFKRVSPAATRTWAVESTATNGVSVIELARVTGTTAISGGNLRGAIGNSSATTYRDLTVSELYSGIAYYNELLLSTIPAGLIDLTIRANTGDASDVEVMSFGPLQVDICM